MSRKKRLDVLLVEQGIARDEKHAVGLILSGEVLVENTPVDKVGVAVDESSNIRLRHDTKRFVSRGGEKLQGALDHFRISIPDICLDVGSSTGGFTDCLLQNGASFVYAVDVGTNQLHQQLRTDKRVRVMEQTHVKDIQPEQFSPLPSFATVDVSFIGLGAVLPHVLRVLSPECFVLALVKPQFELERALVSPGGVVPEEGNQMRAVKQVYDISTALGLSVEGVFKSLLRGEKMGNQEYFLLLKRN